MRSRRFFYPKFCGCVAYCIFFVSLVDYKKTVASFRRLKTGQHFGNVENIMENIPNGLCFFITYKYRFWKKLIIILNLSCWIIDCSTYILYLALYIYKNDPLFFWSRLNRWADFANSVFIMSIIIRRRIKLKEKNNNNQKLI